VANPISSLEGGIIGVAIGEGAAAAVEPVVEPAKQEVWQANPYRVLEPGLLAELVVQALVNYGDAADQAKRSGFDGNKFRAMVEASFRAPGTAEALELWRRGRIDKAQMRHALHKAGLETQWLEPVLELFGERLDVAALANAIQQGFVANDGVLPPASPPDPGWTTADGPIHVPTEQVTLHDAEGAPVSTAEEAKASGIDFGRLQVLAELAGLPPGEETLIDMWRRGIIDGSGYAQGLREGHTKTKWTAALSARFYQLLPPGVLVRLRLKGWIEDPEYKARMARHGFRPASAEDWFLAEGRPAAPQQMATAVARGIDGPDGRPMDEAQFVKGIRESDIRPEWAQMLWGIRFAYPPLFQINRLVQAGAIDAATAVSWAHKNRYAPEVVTALDRYWGTGPSATADPYVKRAETQLWSRTHSSFIAGEADEATARQRLDRLGVTGQNQDDVIDLWQEEADLIRKQLTPAQIKKAYAKLVTNPATGQPWTRDDALAALINRGYSFNDASTFLEE
jgi:hypothetical protein